MISRVLIWWSKICSFRKFEDWRRISQTTMPVHHMMVCAGYREQDTGSVRRMMEGNDTNHMKAILSTVSWSRLMFIFVVFSVQKRILSWYGYESGQRLLGICPRMSLRYEREGALYLKLWKL